MRSICFKIETKVALAFCQAGPVDSPSPRAVSPCFPVSSVDQGMAEEAEKVQVDVDGESVDAGVGEYIEAELEAEVQHKLVIPTPEAPTASEFAEHRDGGHAPYRPWWDE